jgi:hypothetical protein
MAVVHNWSEKLEQQCELAKTSEEGTERFVEMCSNPMRHTWIVSGGIKDDGSGEHTVNTRMVGQPDYYPVTPGTKHEIIREGYRRYLSREIARQREGQDEDFIALPIQQWSNKFNSVTLAVDQAVRDCHGVKCYEDGDLTNEDPTNVFFLHVCDIFNIYCDRLNDRVPEVYIATNSFNVIHLDLRNMLTDSIMTQDELDFFVKEADFFYTCFCYYGNFSFLPIRTQVSSDNEAFRTSSFFTNDDYYRNHQRGKFLQISQDHQRMLTPVVYRTV